MSNIKNLVVLFAIVFVSLWGSTSVSAQSLYKSSLIGVSFLSGPIDGIPPHGCSWRTDIPPTAVSISNSGNLTVNIRGHLVRGGPGCGGLVNTTDDITELWVTLICRGTPQKSAGPFPLSSDGDLKGTEKKFAQNLVGINAAESGETCSNPRIFTHTDCQGFNGICAGGYGVYTTRPGFIAP